MAISRVDLDFRRTSSVISEAIDSASFAAAALIKKRADQKIHIGKIRRNTATSGKYKGKAWTSRRPGRAKKTGRAYKSRFKRGGGVVMYGSFMAFYVFMHHWGVKNRYGKKIAANKFLTEAASESSSEINRLATKSVKDATK
jgi:hypothetical protein